MWQKIVKICTGNTIRYVEDKMISEGCSTIAENVDQDADFTAASRCSILSDMEAREVVPEAAHFTSDNKGRRSQEYFIDVQQNLETLNHDLSVASWDLTTPWSGTCEGITSTTILATIDASASAWQSSSPPNAEPSGNA